MTGKFVLDACALIAFLNDEPGADVVEGLLESAKDGTTDLAINKINLLEIYYGILREDGVEVANAAMDAIMELPIRVVSSLSDEVFREAGRLKAKNRISLADSIAVAEANIGRAKLVTADHHELDALEKTEEVNAYWIR